MNNLEAYAPLIGKKVVLPLPSLYNCDHRCSMKGGKMDFSLQYCMRQGVLTPREDGDPFPSFGQRVVPLSGYLRVPAEPDYLIRSVAQQPVLLTLICGDDFDYQSGLFEGEYSSSNLGYHAINCIGYDDESFILQNSWGDQWGEEGFMRITPYGLRTMMVRGFMPFVKPYTTSFNTRMALRFMVDYDYNHLGCFCPRDRKSIAVNHLMYPPHLRYPEEYFSEYGIIPTAKDKGDDGKQE